MSMEGQQKVTEKTFPGQSLECRRVLGIVPFGGTEVPVGKPNKHFDLAFGESSWNHRSASRFKTGGM